MSSVAEVQDTEGKWVFIAPVANLYLREAVTREIRIDRVLFVSAKKLPRGQKPPTYSLSRVQMAACVPRGISRMRVACHHPSHGQTERGFQMNAFAWFVRSRLFWPSRSLDMRNGRTSGMSASTEEFCPGV